MGSPVSCNLIVKKKSAPLLTAITSRMRNKVAAINAELAVAHFRYVITAPVRAGLLILRHISQPEVRLVTCDDRHRDRMNV